MNLRDMLPAVTIIILIGLVLGIGLYVMDEVQENIATERTGEDNNLNLTDTQPENTTTLSDASKEDYELLSVDSVVNGTGDEIPDTYYNASSDGVITWSSDLVAGNTDYYASNDSNVNVTSTFIYAADGTAEGSLNETIEGLSDFSGWIAVIVVVIAAAIVLGIVLRSFGQTPEA